MSRLRLILDQLTAPVPGGVGRYTAELTRALIDSAPDGSDVSGFISATSPDRVERLRADLPGLADLAVSRLDRRALALAWANGLTHPRPTGLIHSPSPLAPLFRHDRPALQVAVTVHDVVPWSYPETLTARGVAWHRRIIARAKRYADAIVVPSHAVSDEIEAIFGPDDRVRIIPGGVSSELSPPPDALTRRISLGLPQTYVLAIGSIEPRKGLAELVQALTSPVLDGLHLVHVGPSAWGGVTWKGLLAEHKLDPGRFHALGWLPDADLASVLAGASVFAMPSVAEGFGLPLLEAMSLGVPTVHTDVPALSEVAAGAGIEVERAGAGLSLRLADGIASVLSDKDLASRLSVLGRDRARAFSWRDSAEKVWQLHADL